MTNQKLINDCKANLDKLDEWQKDTFLPYIEKRVRNKKRLLTVNEKTKLDEMWLKATKEEKL